LVDDIRYARSDPDRAATPYVLGAVILHQRDGRLDVVDGQQRLLTLRMILGVLDTSDFLEIPTVGENPVTRVWWSLARRLAALPADEASDLVTFIRDRCELVRVVTDDVDEAFRVFDSQNYRGKPLAPHDLLKAHHLREMRDETPAMKAAVTHDIGMFKGISPTSVLTPAHRYHLAAQAALPMLSALGATNGLDQREAGRSRFQLDVPLVAGRPFFEMVTFMLEELKALQGFPPEVEAFSVYDPAALAQADVLEERQSRSRYRYVCELYLAALLYYTNRFGDDALEESRPQLFAWAYALRAELLRVQFRSVDNRGRGDGSSMSAFALLRNAASGRVANQLSTSARPYSDNHEAALVEALSAWAAS
jgi:hypothetical protein